jgi:purine nucleoside permease
MGRVDFQRVLFLRTASNYCMQPPGQDVNKSLHEEYDGYFPRWRPPTGSEAR